MSFAGQVLLVAQIAGHALSCLSVGSQYLCLTWDEECAAPCAGKCFFSGAQTAAPCSHPAGN